MRLLLALCLALLVVPAAPAAPVAPAGLLGVNSHIATRYPDYKTLDRAADAVAQTGAGWAREDFQWHRIEPRPGAFDWGFNDRAVDLLAARGVSVLGVLGPSVGWATPFGGDAPGGVSFYPPDPGRYAQFAAAVAARFRGRVSHWEIWNEPDNALYWRPAPDPAAYVRLLQAAAPAIRAANPEAKILLGGVVPFDGRFLRAVADAGAWGLFDIISVHPYVDPASPEEGQIGPAGIGAVRALADAIGPKPIWATELGWAAGPGDRDPAGRSDEQAQASYLVRAAALLLQAGAEKVFWYNLKDDGGFNPYGLFRTGGGKTDYSQPRPALAALRALATTLSGAWPAGLQFGGEPQVINDFEQLGAWRRGNQPNGTLTASDEQRRGGVAAAKLSYSFPGRGNDYVVFTAQPPRPIPGTLSQLGLWVYGDGSGHALKLWLRDAQGETLQFRLGYVGAPGWQLLSAPISGQVEAYNRISGRGNGRLDFPISLAAIVLDDEPDGASGRGAIFLDDLSAVGGPELYSARFARADATVELLWAPRSASVSIDAAGATILDRGGAPVNRPVADGRVALDLGPSPLYVLRPSAGP
jgi:hypothetical protein